MLHPRELKDACLRGENISSLLRDFGRTRSNTESIIETAYDLQSGNYIQALDDPAVFSHKTDYGEAIARQIYELTNPSSIIEAGVGEGTTFSFVLDSMAKPDLEAHGFDISWSRIRCCERWLRQRARHRPFLTVASLLHLPYRDSCFDVVYTSHTIEPNGGQESGILRELHRVASRFLVLLEPGYELASPEARERMDMHGYCRNLVGTAEALGMRVVKHELFPYCLNELNPTAITVIEKSKEAPAAVPKFACPHFGDPLVDYGDSFYSRESLRAYPKIRGIPCLRPQDGVIASKYEELADDLSESLTDEVT